MAFLAERQAFGCSLYPFLAFGSQFYETPSHYQSVDSTYVDIARIYIPNDWRTQQAGIWFHVEPPETRSPQEGFKIHLSAIPKTGSDILRKALPALVAANVPFKFAVDSQVLGVLTSKNFPRELAGKFITIYPEDEIRFRELAEELTALTASFTGPYILSDKRFKQSKVVFYRYGGFAANYAMNWYGEQVPVITCGTDHAIEDTRTPFRGFPPGIKDPFAEGADVQRQAGPIILHNRYQIDKPINFTNAGGVYKGIDLSDGAVVILKEARQYIGADVFHTADAISQIRHERAILNKLKPSTHVPHVIDSFTEWEHDFLVINYVNGFPLPSFQSQETIGLITARVPSRQTIERFSDTFWTLTKHLVGAVEECHAAGVVIGDLAPQNVIVDPVTLEITLIDFGNAYTEDDDVVVRVFTPGFVLPRIMDGARPSFEDDQYALRRLLCSILYPIQSLSVLSEIAERKLLRAVLHEYCLPSRTKRFLSGLIDAPKQLTVHEIEKRYCGCDAIESTTADVAKTIKSRELERVIENITAYINSTASIDRADRLWPADYRVFSGHPLSLAFGALGIALFLHTADKHVPLYAREWIQSRRIDPKTTAPGFFTGLAGIAWGLWLLGFQERAVSLSRTLSISRPDNQLDDLFYGNAGIGLSQLYFWYSTHDSVFLDSASAIADALCASGQTDLQGKCWPHADGIPYHGLAHGGSGIALFLLKMYRATNDAKYLANALAGLEYVIVNATDQEDLISWARFPGDAFLWPYWRSGTAGIGSVLIRFFATTQDTRFRDLAARAAQYLARRFTSIPGQFNGLSGLGEFFIDMYQQTQESQYLEHAFDVARKALLFQIEKHNGACFPGEDLLRISNDFGTGSAGIGMFLCRLIHLRPHPFLDEPASALLPNPSSAFNDSRSVKLNLRAPSEQP